MSKDTQFFDSMSAVQACLETAECKKNIQYQLHLKGYVGGYDFDADYVDYILSKHSGKEVHVLIDSLGGQSNTALSIFSAFKRHGNVSVHFVGMNASAATIASLGAKHITMDASAMYLVHKCSIGFFEWGQLNSDDLQMLIDHIEHQKKDLDKLDANIAQMYATRCKKEPSALLALMKEGGWLTAQEALAWGFVDELTDYEDETAPVLTDTTAQALAEAGIPIPNLPKSTADQSAMARFLNALTSIFKSNNSQRNQSPNDQTTNSLNHQSPNDQTTNPPNHQTPMKKILTFVCAILACDALESKEGSITLTDEQFDSIEDAIKADREKIKSLNDQLTSLQAENEELKKRPADTTAHVVDDKHGKQQPSAVDDFVGTRQAAQSLYDLVP